MKFIHCFSIALLFASSAVFAQDVAPSMLFYKVTKGDKTSYIYGDIPHPMPPKNVPAELQNAFSESKTVYTLGTANSKGILSSEDLQQLIQLPEGQTLQEQLSPTGNKMLKSILQGSYKQLNTYRPGFIYETLKSIALIPHALSHGMTPEDFVKNQTEDFFISLAGLTGKPVVPLYDVDKDLLERLFSGLSAEGLDRFLTSHLDHVSFLSSCEQGVSEQVVNAYPEDLQVYYDICTPEEIKVLEEDLLEMIKPKIQAAAEAGDAFIILTWSQTALRGGAVSFLEEAGFQVEKQPVSIQPEPAQQPKSPSPSAPSARPSAPQKDLWQST